MCANGTIFLKGAGPGATVFDDGVVDVLAGKGGMDWFFANTTSGVQDDLRAVVGAELVEDID